LAAEHAPQAPTRRANIEALQSATNLEVQWFPTGHWISAEDTAGVARAVVDFVHRL